MSAAAAPPNSRSPAPRRGLRRRVGPLVLAALVALAAGITAGVSGFLQFAAEVRRLHPPTALQPADGIVTLTGGTQGRLDTGLSLLQAGYGERLLISGVNQDLSDEALIKGLGVAAPTAACCLDLGRAARDTLGNAAETADWAARNGYRRLIVVTDDYHMPRSFIELRAAMPEVELVAYPVQSPWSDPQRWGRDPRALARLVLEYAKLLAVMGRETLSGAAPPAPGAHRSTEPEPQKAERL